jgi:hypothetical protein
VDSFAGNLETLPQTLHETFLEGLRQRLHKRSRNQEPYQELNQKQNPSALRAKRADTKGTTTNNGDGVATSLRPELLSIAREALQLVDSSTPIDELLDTFGAVCQTKGQQTTWTRATAVEALNAALAEQRAAS